MSDLNPYEQYLLELINRARADPGAEAARLGISLNQGLSPGTIRDTEKQPLAANEFLNDAAADHSQWMLATNIFSHTGQGGSSAGDRIEDAGYTNWRTWGENISYRGGGNVQSVSVVEGHHDGLFKSSGHRRNLLNDGFTEIGLGQEYGRFNNSNASMLTQILHQIGAIPFCWVSCLTTKMATISLIRAKNCLMCALQFLAKDQPALAMVADMRSASTGAVPSALHFREAGLMRP